jgi:peptide/nickel transport system permease protein
MSAVALDAATAAAAGEAPVPRDGDAAAAAAPVLEVRDLTVAFPTDSGAAPLRAVDGVSFAVRPGSTLAIVGESGCGKSVTALAIMGLLAPTARIGGSVRLLGREIATLTPEEWRERRGRDLAMIFQEPMTSLNPAFTAGEQVAEVLRTHAGLDRRAAMERAVAMLTRVRIPDAARRARQYPHQLSGGMRQRVMIALALACRPKLLIADEPTTALDVTVQAQVMELLLRLREELGFALILVSHDLALVADVTDRVVVMYGGQIVETGVTADLVEEPAHHYTRGLLGSVLSLESAEERMTQIRGVVPSPADFPAGCRFAGRCPLATGVCRTTPPDLLGTPAHTAACHHPAVDLVTSPEAVQ